MNVPKIVQIVKKIISILTKPQTEKNLQKQVITTLLYTSRKITEIYQKNLP